ncbi:MAG TPA: ribosome-associated translation inhibitor RaiA [Dehalococcoidales bacterium]|nr:ribosome-associated translation inhibitor RaiA [Dehalococcoidales bacterium]
MEILITGKNLDVLPKVREYINKKLGKADKYLNKITSFEVVVSEESTRSPEQRSVVQVTINNHGTILRAEERGPDMKTAIDKAVEVLGRQIEHYRGKQPHAQKRKTASIRTAPVISGTPLEAEIQPEENGPRIVKTKKFDIKPMSVEEAADQMVLLSHDFFLFFNQDSDKINLLYRRKDGNYGLIEPNFAR